MSGVRAPGEDGAVLCVPGFHELPGLGAQNHLEQSRLPPPWVALRTLARAEVLELLGLDCGYKDRPWVVCGHQPEVCHPGVWAKYFATRGVANAMGALAFNLVADSDLSRQIWLPYPDRGPEGLLSRGAIRVGAGDCACPWERAEALGSRADWNPVWKSLRAKLGIDSIGRKIIESPEEAGLGGCPSSLSEFNTHLRQKGQQALGLDLPDVCQSVLVQTQSFSRFVWAILGDIGRFAHIHNEALAAFRNKNGITNPGQPMADLKKDGDWHEAPFWILEKHTPVRRPLWISPRKGGLVLGGRPGEVLAVLDPEDPEVCVGELSAEGLGIRPRALTNTLFMRWLVCDLFVHGLGGAIYDQVTDQVGREWFGGTPPGYALVTATLRLPLPVVPCEEEKDLQRDLRQFWWNPDRLPGETGLGNILLDEWRTLRLDGTSSGPDKRAKARRLLWKIHVEAAENYKRYDDRIRNSVLARASNRVAKNREWPWILYPDHSLRELLTPLLDGAKYASGKD